ncbi:MAG: hypothetical protein PF450_16350 [Bacteroidales bacterium]|nr:hypothetical protein [Bacteroidales bacterium]
MMEKQKGLFDQATMVMERISRELRDAESISEPVDGASGSTLTFTKSHGTGEEVYDNVTDIITFQLSALDSTLLERERTTKVGTTTVTLADNVSTFTAGRVTSGADSEKEEITITLTLQEAGAGEVKLRSYICPKNLYYPDADVPAGRNFGGDWEEHIQE